MLQSGRISRSFVSTSRAWSQVSKMCTARLTCVHQDVNQKLHRRFCTKTNKKFISYDANYLHRISNINHSSISGTTCTNKGVTNTSLKSDSVLNCSQKNFGAGRNVRQYHDYAYASRMKLGSLPNLNDTNFSVRSLQTFHSNPVYDVVVPGNVSPSRIVPVDIDKPVYANDGRVPPPNPDIDIKEGMQILKMRNSCSLARKVLNIVADNLLVGMTTDDIDKIVHEACVHHRAYPSPLNYKGFPKSVCTSVNNVACHGIPDDRRLQDGDIVNVDITVYYNGYHGDCSETFMIGGVDDRGRELVHMAKLCRDEAIRICGPGVPFQDIGATISMTAESAGFGVIPCFIGHGIGTYFHGLPDIFPVENDFPGVMKPGMTFTIEPIVVDSSVEDWESVIILEDGWTAVSPDNSRSAQFEHTVLITEDGVEILTK